MSTILGLVGSARPWGNGELLVRQALRGAQAEGCSVRLLRLTGLHLEPCSGCLRCVIGARSCRLDDDMAWLIDTIQAADGLVLAAPTYFLGPAAVVKLILDRLLMVTGRVDDALPAPRPAITLATAGLEDWQGVTLPFLNAMAAAFGYLPIESLLAVAPGPGEVLLNDALLARVLEAGRRLGRGELEVAPAPPNVCPICRCQAFALVGERATCPICGCQARIEQVGQQVRLHFEPADSAGQRWTPEGLRQHMIDWIMATGPRFLEHRDEIKARRRPFREAAIDWLCPEGTDGKSKSPEGTL